HCVDQFVQILRARGIFGCVALPEQVEIARAPEYSAEEFGWRQAGYVFTETFDQVAKAAQWGQAGQSLFHQRYQRRPERAVSLAGPGAQQVYRLRADAARRHIQNAKQGDIVLGVKDQPHVGQRVLDLGALVEAEAPQDAIADLLPPERLFERPRLRVRAVEHGDVEGRILPLEFQDLLSDISGLGRGVARFGNLQVGTLATPGVQRFAQPARVFCHYAAGRVQDLLCRAIVLFETKDPGGGKILREAQEVANVGAAPAIDRLVLIADDAKVLPHSSQQVQQVVLHAVRVLVFVHVNKPEALAPALAHVTKAPKDLHRAQQQVVEIERTGSAQDFLIGLHDPRAPLTRFVLCLGRELAAR